MKISLDRHSNIFLRLIAFPLALLCLWMATVGVIDHTDDFQSGASRSSRVVWHQAGVVPPSADACVACAWLAALQTSTPAAVPAVSPHLLYVCSFPALHAVCLRYSLPQTGSRAPPASHLTA